MNLHDWGASLDNITLKLGNQDFAFDCGFERGKVTAVVGPSGSGKSTLLNLVAGFEAPDMGRVLIDGQDMHGLDPSERPVSLIFQDNNLFAHLDIFTNVGLGVNPSLKLSQDEKTSVKTALARVGLAGFEKRLPSSMSGGERQRAALARALVRKRSLMLLDEPFAALDPGLRAGMAGLLKDLHGEMKNTILLVTHHPDDIRRLAQSVVFLSAGRILYKGSVDDFFAAKDVEEINTFLAV
ncbi:ATP-binding cassette domain-containing protein [Agrobacterium sp. rho-13.3]|uniref:thiamine ABC transporter ATP-binding protein n=1 Tax=Agrobacterium sp. rho-13.3 TaxID=3072980 RepID=UPI002A18129A|nr:ATP-binding cassette domain-containing protein [Agrobacterium sp. rho-13.3]MDX8310715.1 ATP-binding cassette domain-containing protein [Agrobacterium sp. rho-13.3]